jgi:hypothetical protein
VDESPFAAAADPDRDWLHDASAGRDAIAGDDVEMAGAEAAATVVSMLGAGARAGNFGATVFAGEGGRALVGRFITFFADHLGEQAAIHRVASAGDATFSYRFPYDAARFLAVEAIAEAAAADDEVGEGVLDVFGGTELDRELAHARGVDDAEAVGFDELGGGGGVAALAGVAADRADFGVRGGNEGGEEGGFANAGMTDDGAGDAFEGDPDLVDALAGGGGDGVDGDADLDVGVELCEVLLEFGLGFVEVGLVDDDHRPRAAAEDGGEVAVDEPRMEGRGDDADDYDDDVHVGDDGTLAVTVDRVLAGEDGAALFDLANAMAFAVRFDDDLVAGGEDGLLAFGDFAGEGAIEVLAVHADAAAFAGDVDDGGHGGGRRGGFLEQVKGPLLHAPSGAGAALIFLGLCAAIGGDAGDLFSFLGRKFGQSMT